ncbi:MAG: extracellular solute-binding protein [Chloroflexi bacterium]|nr:extracellular solute-binding protein [Chloroflexota bacterium]
MKNSRTVAILFVFFLLYACTPFEAKGPTYPVIPTATVKSIEKAAWEVEWDKTVSEAKREGTVVIYSSAPPQLTEAVARAFHERFNINLEFTPGRVTELVPKVLAEKRARLHLVDIFMGSTTAVYNPLKPEGFLDDVSKDFLLPEVTDPNVWYEKQLPVPPFDTERKYVLLARASPSQVSNVVNTDLVKDGELVSFHDLLNPKWKGKIAMDDFSQSVGVARTVLRPVYMKTLDWDFWKALVKQEPAVLRDRRLQTDWVARGKYAITIGSEPTVVDEYMKLGAPIKWLSLKEDVQYLAISTGAIVFLTNAPHPNARKVFLNWYFSREGLTVFSRALGAQSSRVDVPTDFLAADEIRDPKITYLLQESPDFARFEQQNWPTVKEIFAPLYK